MKQLLPIYCTALLALANPAKVAARSFVFPADTVAGHARVVQKLSEAMCAQLSNDHATAYDKMTPTAAMQMTQQLFIAAMKRDSTAFISLITTGAAQGQSAQAVGQAVGKDVVLRLSQTCPAALPLIVRLSQTDEAKKAMATTVPNVTEAEKKVLQPLVSHMCAQLVAADAKQPFAKLTAAQRSALFTSLMQKEFTVGRPQLLHYYSAAQLGDAQAREDIGKKMAALMLGHSSCAGYLLLVGADEMTKSKP